VVIKREERRGEREGGRKGGVEDRERAPRDKETFSLARFTAIKGDLLDWMIRAIDMAFPFPKRVRSGLIITCVSGCNESTVSG
jgi:hypothetical protein